MAVARDARVLGARTVHGMSTPAFVALLLAAVIGLPLVLLGLGAAGPVGWVLGAAALPLVVYGTIVWLARTRRRGE